MGWDSLPQKKTQQTTGKHESEAGVLRMTTTFDDKLKRPVVKLAPMFYESNCRGKNRVRNVGASHQQPKEVDLEHAG